MFRGASFGSQGLTVNKEYVGSNPTPGAIALSEARRKKK